MVCYYYLVLAAALAGFRAACALLRCPVYAICGCDSRGATVYDQASRPTHRRLARDEDLVVQLESAAWDVAITWSRLVLTGAPQPLPARERAALMVGYLRGVADWMALPPPARWSHLMRVGGSGWPVGPSLTGAPYHSTPRANPRAQSPGSALRWWAAPSPFGCWTRRNVGPAQTWSSLWAPSLPESEMA